jgi:23S rRNA (uracil1939-C5)-methyltransferase
MQDKLTPGTILETTITRIGSEGDGVGAYNGLHVIVPKTAIGDKISCTIKYTAQDRIHADLLSIIEPSPSRTTPPCEYFDSCGGCGLQHINFDGYKNYKLGLLTSALQNNNIPLPSSIPWFSVGEHKRRRAFLHFDTSGKLGFYEHQSHNVISIKQCLILEPELEALLSPLEDISRKLTIKIKGWMVTNTDSGIDLTLHSDEAKIKDESFIFKTLASFAKQNNIARLSWKRGGKFLPVSTLTKPVLTINGIDVTLPSEYFLQAAKAGQEAILNAVLPHIDADAKVLDLFSGLGIYSFAIADKAAKTGAYEIAPEMVEAMEDNIRRHKLGEKLTAYCRDIETFPLSREELAKFDTAIINPPRTGALKQVSTLASGGIAKIIMVSCDSRTFARDAKLLHNVGYNLTHLSAIDQFYYSHHLEQVGVFVRS